MKTRPIIFQPEMVRAIFEDRKSQTRRILKPQPEKDGIAVIDAEFAPIVEKHVFKTWLENKDGGHDYDYNPETWKCPYGAPGDRLWVREKWRIFDAWEECGCSEDCSCAQHHGRVLFYADILCDESKWKPSIHMFRKHSRLTLEITNVRVERIKEISAQDCMREGFFRDDLRTSDVTLTLRFMRLWDKMHGKKYPWSENPWVWVVEFKKESK